MKNLRKNTIDRIINAADTAKIDKIIEACIKTLKENNAHEYTIARFLSKLEEELSAIQPINVTTKIWDNIKHAKACLRASNQTFSQSRPYH